MVSSVSIEVMATPNPNSMKFTLDRVLLVEGHKSYDSLEEAGDSPLAQSLFEVAGVKSVFILGDFISVGRLEGHDWGAIIPKVEEAIREYFSSTD